MSMHSSSIQNSMQYSSDEKSLIACDAVRVCDMHCPKFRPRVQIVNSALATKEFRQG